MGWSTDKAEKKCFVSTYGLNKVDVDAEMSKSVLTPNYDMLKHVSPYDVSDKQLKKQRRVRYI